MAPNRQSAAYPLPARTAVNVRMRGVMSIRMSCCPSAMGLYASRFPVAVPLGISQITAAFQDSRMPHLAGWPCTRAPGALAPAQAALL